LIEIKKIELVVKEETEINFCSCGHDEISKEME
jgi:hypothetical protein